MAPDNKEQPTILCAETVHFALPEGCDRNPLFSGNTDTRSRLLLQKCGYRSHSCSHCEKVTAPQAGIQIGKLTLSITALIPFSHQNKFRYRKCKEKCDHGKCRDPSLSFGRGFHILTGINFDFIACHLRFADKYFFQSQWEHFAEKRIFCLYLLHDFSSCSPSQ